MSEIRKIARVIEGPEAAPYDQIVMSIRKNGTVIEVRSCRPGTDCTAVRNIGGPKSEEEAKAFFDVITDEEIVKYCTLADQLHGHLDEIGKRAAFVVKPAAEYEAARELLEKAGLEATEESIRVVQHLFNFADRGEDEFRR